MPNFDKIFNNKKVRSLYDTDRKTHWFSVVDVIAALRNTDYDTARNHWKQIKYRFVKKSNIFKYHQLKLTAKDGKQRFTDVMRYREIVRLVQRLSAGVGKNFRKLTGSIAGKSALMRKVFEELAGMPGVQTCAELRVFVRREVIAPPRPNRNFS